MNRSLSSLIFCCAVLALSRFPVTAGTGLQRDEIQTNGFDPVVIQWDVSGKADIVGYNIYRSIVRSSHNRDLGSNEITVDGNVEDWLEIKEATSYPYPPEDLLHIHRVWAAHDEHNLYLAVQLSGSIHETAKIDILIDVDRDYSTGSGSKDWRGLPIGADLLYYRYFDNPNALYRKEWNYEWDGPFPYDQFLPGNYADPMHAWKGMADITGKGDAAFGTVHHEAFGVCENNFIELRIPFQDMESLTGYRIDPNRFGVDLVVSTFADQFPTVGYGPKSPVKFTYGYEKINLNVVRECFYIDNPLDGLSYDYRVFEVNSEGDERCITDFPIRVHSERVQVNGFNVSIVDPTSLKVEFVYPGNPAVSEVVVVRRNDRYAEQVEDGELVFSAIGNPLEQIEFIDKNLVGGDSYYYSVFSLSSEGDSSREFWSSKDRSVPAIVKGPIEGIDERSSYMVYFSCWDQKRVEHAKKYDLVIVHPGGGTQLITRDQVEEIQRGLDGIRGTDDDVIVIGYVSIGEDFGLAPYILEVNKELGVFPSIDDYPEGSWSIENYYYPRKIPESIDGPVSYSYEQDKFHLVESDDPIYQFPSFYVDMIDYSGQGGAGRDGLPDQNFDWGGLYVNPGDPVWQAFIRKARIGSECVAGIDWVLGTEEGELNCDGIFLDTVGIASTWSQWDPYTYYGDFFWTQHGFLDFFARIGLWYPEKIIMPNRPMHFLFPHMVGKRYDDFRSLVNAIFWESYSADIRFWWKGNYGNLFEETVRQSQDNADGKGFSTLVLDYWNVMIDAEEGGEFQSAPWYLHFDEQIRLSEQNGFIPYITTSRSVAEFADFVYLYRNPEARFLPDLFVHSIATSPRPNGTAAATVSITNIGKSIPEGSEFHIDVLLNGTLLDRRKMNGLKYLEIKSFELEIELEPIGSVLQVTVDAFDQILELDELPDSVESNNTKYRFLEQYLFPTHGWYPEGFAPDLIIEDVSFSPEFPAVGESVEVTIHYRNDSMEGVSSDSRIYYWIVDPGGQRQLGNIPAPAIMPGQTVPLRFSYTPKKSGLLHLGVTADGTKKSIESNERNNNYLSQVLVIASSQSVLDGSPDYVAGPFLDIIGDGTAGDSAADIVQTAFVRKGEAGFFSIVLAERVDLSLYSYIVFIDIGNGGALANGYQVGTIFADLMISDGIVFRFAGKSADDWNWMEEDIDPAIRITDEGRRLEYGIPLDLLSSGIGCCVGDESGKMSFIVNVSDGNPKTLDDVFPSLESAIVVPFFGDHILIDGDPSDWEDAHPMFSRGETNPGEGTAQGYGIHEIPEESAEVSKLSVTWDDIYLYLLIEFSTSIASKRVIPQFFIDSDVSRTTGYHFSDRCIGADYFIDHTGMFSYEGSGDDWVWEPVEQPVYVSALHADYPNVIEIAVEHSAIKWETIKPRLFGSVQFIGEDNDNIGLNEKQFPDTGSMFFSLDKHYHYDQPDFYKFDEYRETGIVIDGDLSDWITLSGVVLIGTDLLEKQPPGYNPYDIHEFWYYRDETGISLMITVAGKILNLDEHYTLYLDIDGESSTGKGKYGFDITIDGTGRVTYLGKQYLSEEELHVPITLDALDGKAFELKVPTSLFGSMGDEVTFLLKFGSGSFFSKEYDEFGPFTVSLSEHISVPRGMTINYRIFYFIFGFLVLVFIIFFNTYHH